MDTGSKDANSVTEEGVEDENCRFAHKASDKVNKSNNLPVITAATGPAESKPSGAEFVRCNSPSYSNRYISIYGRINVEI